jgi:excisionase family DNA binding protein
MTPKTKRPAVERLCLSVPEAAATLGIGETTCRELIARRQLESISIGTRRLVPSAAIDRFVERRLQDSACSARGPLG